MQGHRTEVGGALHLLPKVYFLSLGILALRIHLTSCSQLYGDCDNDIQ